MDLRLVYTNRNGESVEIGGSGHLHLMETDLFGHEWGWEANGRGIASSLQPRQIELPVGMFGGSLEERTRVFEVLEADVSSDSLGTLSFNGFELRCVAVAASLANWWFADGIEERTLSLVAPQPLWTRTIELSFPPVTSTEGDGWLDFEYDAPFDLCRGSTGRTATIPTVGAARWKWIVYGPATNPYVSIGGNRHEVDVAIPAGSRLELDTRERTVEIVDIRGGRTNVFGRRLRGADGSGTYAFKPLPRGRLSIVADSSLSFDIVVYDERMEPAWA